MAEEEVSHVTLRLSNSQAALLAAAIVGEGPLGVLTKADYYLDWLKTNQQDQSS